MEQTSLLLAVGTFEGVDRWTNPNVDETDLGQHFLPGCTRQTTGNSSHPQVNVFERRFGDRLAVRNVGKLESPAWAQHTPYFGEHGSFIGAQIDDAVADDDIGPVVFDWQMFCQSFADALIVKGSDGRDYDLSVEVLWNLERWTIKTEARVDVETGQDVLRQLPDRTASDLSTCMEQIRAAVGDLASFEDLVPGRVRGTQG